MKYYIEILIVALGISFSQPVFGQATFANNLPVVGRFLGYNGAQDLEFRTDNAPRMTLKQTTGRLGLGIAAPTSFLHLTNTGFGELFRTDGSNTLDNYWRLYTGSSIERFHVRTIPNGTLGSDGYHTYLETVNVGSESQLKLLTAELQAVTRGTRLGDFCSVANAPDIVQFGNVTDLVNTFIHTGIIPIPTPTPLGASFWATSGTHRFGVYYDIHAPNNVQMDVIAKAVHFHSS